MAGDLSAAAVGASLAQGQKRQKIRLTNSELNNIPNGAALSIEAVAMGKLNMGDIVCVNLGQGPQVRRFVKLKIAKNDTYILVTHDGYDKKDALPQSALVGRVVEAEVAGKTWDPSAENPLRRFWSKLTEYGTHKPFGIG